MFENHLLKQLAPTLAMLLMVGCAGNVTFAELDDFRVKSAVWLEVDVDVADDEDPDTMHLLLLSNEGGLCDTLTEVLPETVEYSEDIRQADDGDEYCEYYGDLFDYLAESLEPYYQPEESRLVSIELLEREDGDSDWDIEPDDEEYEANEESDWDDDGLYFDMDIAFFEDNPYEVTASHINNDYDEDWGCFDEDGYDAFEDDMDNAVDWYEVYKGDLVLTMDGNDKVEGEFDGRIWDEDEDKEGETAGSFTATRCAIEVETEADFEIPFIM